MSDNRSCMSEDQSACQIINKRVRLSIKAKSILKSVLSEIRRIEWNYQVHLLKVWEGEGFRYLSIERLASSDEVKVSDNICEYLKF